MHIKYPAFVVGLLCLAGMKAAGAPEPSPLFGSHAVLQRGVPVPIWGKADPGEKVAVSFGKVSASTVANASGDWKLQLPALEGGVTGDLVFKGKDQTVTSSDVLTGDVWLCSGQSNIEFTLRKAASAAEEIAAADFPKIRQFKVATRGAGAPVPVAKGEWVVCSPEKAGEFTAVGYYMARALFNQNQQPQGLINCTSGGTTIETWLSNEVLASRPESKALFERWEKTKAEYPAKKAAYAASMAAWSAAKKKADQSGAAFAEKKPMPPSGAPDSRGQPSGSFNAMMYPLIPTAVRAVIWYQGESNWAHPEQYKGNLHALIQDVRSRWNRADLPFFVVQLPNYRGGGNGNGIGWAVLRDAQASTLKLPNTGMVVTLDVGDETEIHYPNKKPVGERLALLARRALFGENVLDSGPVFTGAVKQGKAMCASFDLKGSPLELRAPSPQWRSFELAGADRKFYPATAEAQGNSVRVSCPEVLEPVALRYCWRSYPHATLFNQAGLPSAPFRTDDWDDAQ